uniref:Uncharacterized protein n=1 Tax=Panagrolaimus davidi TaxID=227884 RepID=A0A914QGG8_9BILA
MRCCFGNNISPEEQQNENEEELKKDVVIRFFMAGMGSAGKSTIIRHLIYLCKTNPRYKYCNEDWSEKQNDEIEFECDTEIWKNKIRENIINAFDIFIKQVYENSDKFQNRDLEIFAKSLQNLNKNKSEISLIEMSDLFYSRLICLLKDPAFKRALAMKNRIQIHEPERKLFDGLKYFLNEEKLKFVFSKNYIPSEADKIRCRLPTTGVQRHYFILKKTKIEIYDAGGQKSERAELLNNLNKWNTSRNCTSNNESFILFVASLADYNVRHPNYPNQTLLDESAAFMDILLNNDHIRHCGILIFFNKKDRFFEKLSDQFCRNDIDFIKESLSPIELKEYKLYGRFRRKTMYKAAEYKFIKILKQKYKDRSCYSKNTCAIDPTIMGTFISVIKNEIFIKVVSEIVP